MKAPYKLNANIISNDVFEASQSLESLKEGLKFLLSRYMKHKDRQIASKIVVQLELIMNYHDHQDFPSDRCAFYRLIRYWRLQSS